MCGIAGIIGRNVLARLGDVRRMSESIVHRGPDDGGYLGYSGERYRSFVESDSPLSGEIEVAERFDSLECDLIVTNRRLSIIDLSTKGHQPMIRGELSLVFNGEIYNYVELRHELEKLGCVFTSQSDTEVILAAYEKWGDDCVQRFNGDWAFVLIDPKRRRVLLSRDRFGIKPLYFYDDGDRFCFASEIKALLTLPFVDATIDEAHCVEEMLFSLVDHDRSTAFRKINQVSPGTNLIFDLVDKSIRTRPYYSVSMNRDKRAFDERESSNLIEKTESLLLDAVRIRLRSDVPVGICLSGGLDSSVITAMTSKLLSEKNASFSPVAFTASLSGTPYDETAFAKIAAGHCGAKHFLVTPTQCEFETLNDTLLSFHDEPYGGASVFAQYLVYGLASKSVKVVLDGQGADEIFGGYKNFRVAFLASHFLHGDWKIFFAELKQVLSIYGPVRSMKELKLFPFFLLSPKVRTFFFLLMRSKLAFSHFRKNRLDLTQVQKKMALRFTADCGELMENYIRYSSLPHLLRYVDRNSMACSIEARTPFTDYRLVDYISNVPIAYKFHDGWSKWLLRKVAERYLPDSIAWRKDKLGFAAPNWITKKEVYKSWHNHFSVAQ